MPKPLAELRAPAATSSPLRTCVVGMGAISRAMWPAMAQDSGLDLAVVVDPDVEAARRVPASTPGVALSPSLDEALRDFGADLVVVNSPAQHHVSQTTTALEHGAHVIVAKPLAPTLSEARQLVRHAHEAGRSLAVAEQIRFNAHYEHVRAIIRSGLVGEVRSVILVNSKPRTAVGTLGTARHPALDENACHHFDILRAVLDERSIEAVSCREWNPPWSSYASGSMVNAMLTFEDGIEVLYQGGFAAQAAMYELRLEGEAGVLRCRGEHMSHGPMAYDVSTAGGSFAPIEGHPPVSPEAAWEPFFDQWHHWRATGSDASFSGAQALHVLAAIEAAKKAARTGERVLVAKP